MVDVAAVNGEHTDKNTVADAVILAGVTEPCGRQIAGENRTLHAEHFHTQDFFRNANDARLYDAPFIDHGDAIFVGVQIEGLTLATTLRAVLSRPRTMKSISAVSMVARILFIRSINGLYFAPYGTGPE